MGEIFEVLTTTPRQELKTLAEELKSSVPKPLHSILDNKQNPDAAKEKFRNRKEKETAVCPPTCSGALKCSIECSKQFLFLII